MSDYEVATPIAASHARPVTGGKTVASVQIHQKPRYKSWRKKYRKRRHHFDAVMDDNRRMFKEEQKLEGIAKRLQEELDGIMELLLDLNSSSNVPAALRFNINLPRHDAANSIPPAITPEEANAALLQHQLAMQQGQIPQLEFHLLRAQVEARLAAQHTRALATLESTIPHPITSSADTADPREPDSVNFLTSEREDKYLDRLDAQLRDPYGLQQKASPQVSPAGLNFAELTPREVERRAELENPLSQHNWLKVHARHATGAADGDDGVSESSQMHDHAASKIGRKRNLAKKVGDRAVERAREGHSPSEAVGGGGGGMGSSFRRDEDVTEEEREELELVDAESKGFLTGAGRRIRGGDGDGAYRPKGGKGGNRGGKRKRTAEEGSVGGSAKKARVGDGYD